jgi:hypothetical protein
MMIWTLAQDATAVKSWPDVFADVAGPGVLFLLIFSVPIIAIAGGILKSILAERGVQRTRQEIAAYVAEGSMTANEGERLLTAGTDTTRDK